MLVPFNVDECVKGVPVYFFIAGLQILSDDLVDLVHWHEGCVFCIQVDESDDPDDGGRDCVVLDCDFHEKVYELLDLAVFNRKLGVGDKVGNCDQIVVQGAHVGIHVRGLQQTDVQVD